MANIDIEELIARPLDVIARLRGELKARDGSGSGTQESAQVAKAISEALCSGASPPLERVPVLSRESLAEGKLAANSLVRYRGMVQDQYEPEYFVGSFEEVQTDTGKRNRVDVRYVDSIAQKPGFVNEYDGPGAKTMERLPLYCVPVPGQSKWAMPPIHGDRGQGKEEEEEDAAAAGGMQKRQRDDIDERGRGDAMDCTVGDEAAELSAVNGHTNGNSQTKVPRASGEGTEVATSNGVGTRKPSSLTPNGKSAAPAFHHGQELELAGLACVVKAYDFREGQIKLNDTAEFVGVLGYDHAAAASVSDEAGVTPDDEDVAMGGGDAAAEQQQVSPSEAGAVAGNPFQGLEDFSRKIPPPSLAPRLHCVFHRKLAACAPLPIDPERPQDALHALLEGGNPTLPPPTPLPLGAFMRDAKGKAIEHLARALKGDVLAAEYALLALLSRAYVRTESLAPGSLSLNLRGVSADEAVGFHDAVSELVPKCVAVPVTTKSLSEKFKFAPKKDYDADRLMMSSLQLSDGTVVVLDETKLEPGQVGTEGVGNLAALNSLISLQKVPYDFGFYKMEFEVDHPTISLSVRGSVVPAGATVPVIAAADLPATPDAAGGVIAAVSDGSEEEEAARLSVLTRLRVYVEATRRTELSLDEESSALAEEDFVKARQNGQAITGEDFHRMLTIARLTALSLGDSKMTTVHWSYMKDLEARVAGRVQQQASEAGGGGGDRTSGAGVVPASGTPAALGATPISPSGHAGPLNAIPEND
ncbi:unnamed protein product [Scytosiphon promiscuus]